MPAPGPDTRPTDTLANERTYLAYLRTALAFVGFGFVIARFSLYARELSVVAHVSIPESHTSVTFGIAMALAGMVVGLYGSWRYVIQDRALRAQSNAPMPQWAAIGGGIAIALIGAVVAIDLLAFH